MTTFLIFSNMFFAICFIRTFATLRRVLGAYKALHECYEGMRDTNDRWREIALENKDLVEHNFEAHWDAEVHRAVLDSPFSEPRSN